MFTLVSLPAPYGPLSCHMEAESLLHLLSMGFHKSSDFTPSSAQPDKTLLPMEVSLLDTVSGCGLPNFSLIRKFYTFSEQSQ